MRNLPSARDISLRQVEAFHAVMEAGSITGAADLMCITQPAVSRLIKDLEQRIGFSLFERRKGRVMPTVEALALFEEVQRAFTGLEKIASAAEEIRSFRAGYLQIASLPALAMRFLPRIITAFSEKHPGINVSVQIRSSTKVGEWVGSQQIDAGFAALQSSPAGVEQMTLYNAPLVVVLPSAHRLAREKVLTPEKLRGEPLVSLGSEYGIRQRTIEAYTLAGVPLTSRIETQLSLAVCEFVIAGAGVGLVEPVSANEMTDRGIVLRPFEPKVPYFVSLLLPVSRTQPVFFTAFISMVIGELEKNPHVEVTEEAYRRFGRTA